jgi:hypothetical protein
MISWSQRPLHDNTNGQTFMPPVGFEPTISGGERLQTYILNGAATGTGLVVLVRLLLLIIIIIIIQRGMKNKSS